MFPHVRYVKSSDGTSIAYWTLGSGGPLVLGPLLPLCHLQLEWEIPQLREAFENLASRHMLVAYDARGLGMSQRNVANLSLDAHVNDVEALMRHLELERAAVMGMFHSGPIAIRFASLHPSRVSRLLLWASYAYSPDYPTPRLEAASALMDKDWDAFAETMGFYASGWTNQELGRSAARLIRECASPDEVLDALAAIHQIDVREDLAKLRCPTLVMYRRKVAWPEPAVALRLAAGIKDSRLIGFEGDGFLPWASEADQVVAAIDEFLDEGIGELRPNVAIAAPGLKDLTDRELEVLRLLATGSSNKEIAAALTLSVHTVERHLANIYGKIDARGRADATAFAIRNRIS